MSRDKTIPGNFNPSKKNFLQDETRQEGWTWTHSAKKPHYFIDERSLCGNYGLLHPSAGLNGELSYAMPTSPCRTCFNKLNKI